jgi:hypothetical protein
MANTLAYCRMELSRVVKFFLMQTPRDQTSRKYTLLRKSLPSKVARLGSKGLVGFPSVDKEEISFGLISNWIGMESLRAIGQWNSTY